MGQHLNDAHRGERIRDGFRIAIIGPPNAGKSSLLNALAQREAAIVSDIPGTTRDVVEVRLVLAGYPVWIADTAGLRKAADAIEAEGVRRALARAEEADMRLGLVDGQAEASEAVAIAERLRPGDLLVSTKRDIPHGAAFYEAFQIYEDLHLDYPAWVSVKTGEGLAELEASIARRVAEALDREEAPVLTRARHRRLVEEARAALQRAIPALNAGPELAAEDVRVAADQIGRLTGRIDVEDLLGEIFSSFCIGK
jgi:tRNA modification GTPase